ncbi:nucleotidyl transferase AbiEii/AbiGii toxin family protein [Nonomuraea wenchangensis]|uniref:nucleotidyl transferase AbiEii/AbiGii toxin family protein n=1 Tax=Nonomuraea wenchangensis TaxID=568860 RepID=UPI0033CF3806
MTRYRDAVALRQALENRLKRQADENGTDLGRLRRRVLFERALARLAVSQPGRWILKGGMAMEFRLLDRARSTKDLDLAIRSGHLDGDGLRDELIEALSADPDGDNFVFQVAPPTELKPDGGGRRAYRFGIQGRLAGKDFALFRLDAAMRPEEIAQTDQLMLPGTLAFAEVRSRSVEAVHPRQHFAEKLHALTRDYGDRPNTRVKDLVDLVLLIENGLAPDGELVDVCRHVFTVRATHALPEEIPDLPPRWDIDYPTQAQGLTNVPADLSSALGFVRDFWQRAIACDSGGREKH